ncbi:MAG: IS481 family transposase, partial [Acetobacteraceae bacterium]|nr:IS481 family transposase [Acetobacteraceae bacterium]
QDLYVEHGDRRFGPYTPSGGPIPLHRYRKYQKSKLEERADRVAVLAERLGLPRATLDGTLPSAPSTRWALDRRPFSDPDPFQQLAYPSPLAAKHAIADELGMPLARLSAEDRAFIDALLRDTLEKSAVLTRVREHFRPTGAGVGSC